MNNSAIWFSFLVLTVTLTGCAGQKHFNEKLSNRWIDSFRQYQIYPTFTSREDIQVGDLILTCELNQLESLQNNKGSPPISVLLTRFNVNTELQSFYNKSVKLPKSASNPSENQKSDGELILKNAAFPDFLTAKISGSDIGAAFPTGKIMAGFGISSKDIESVSISVPAVGTYQLPIADLISAIIQSDDKSTVNPEWKKLSKLNKFVENYGAQNCANKKPVLMLVSEVYAAYGLKVDINLSATSAASIKAAVNISDSKSKLDLINAFGSIFGISPESSPPSKPNNSDDNQEGVSSSIADDSANKPTANEDIDKPASPGKTSKELKTTSRIEEFKQYLELVTNKSDANSEVGYPGVKISTYSGSVAGISIDRTFSTPVVVGVKGVKLNICKKPSANVTSACVVSMTEDVTELYNDVESLPTDIEPAAEEAPTQ